MPLSPIALGGHTRESFLLHYWQRRPLYLPGALNGFTSPLSADEVAGLACEEFIESRLISGPAAQGAWKLSLGPFTEHTLAALPETDWTLHAQGIEQILPDVYRLFDSFRFLPTWRLEDIMISLSADNGSAGPHFDQYDVFLIQAEGNKHWQLGQHCDENTPLMNNSGGLQLVDNFACEQELLCAPGDLLYIPPGVAHYGRSEGQSITYSVGFRAPSAAELCLHLAEELTESRRGARRYSDAGRNHQTHPGLLSGDDIEHLQGMLRAAIEQTDTAELFGKLLTQPKQVISEIISEVDDAQDSELSRSEFRALVEASSTLCWQAGSRFCYTESPEALRLFVNGDVRLLDYALLPLVKTLTASTVVAVEDLDLSAPASLNLIYSLNQNNWLILD